MFKRPPVRNANHLVNASLALGLLFIVTACDTRDEQGIDPILPENSSGIAPAIENPTERFDGISLPAVWSSDNLGKPIRSVAVAGRRGSLIAVGFEDGDVQLLNFEGDRVTEPADLGITALANGEFGMVGGALLTIFPGVDRDGGLNAYLYGGEIAAPIPFPLDIGSRGRVKGLCSGRALDDRDGVMRLAFWTEGAVSQLQSGRLVEVADTLVFLADEPVEADNPITACVLEPTGAKVFTAPVTHAVSLERNGRRNLIALDDAGGLTLIGEDDPDTDMVVVDGLSVRAPNQITSFAGTGDARSGGYPGGLIVLVGAISTSEHRAVLVDPSDLTLSAFERPAVLAPE
ncbi:MAG: hypothetical protein AAF296_00230 [Pseudomonadota bacterium]